MSNSRSNVPHALRRLGVRNMNITELSFFFDNLNSLPKEIGNLQKLKTLNLQGNNLKSLPKEIGNLTNLEGLYLDTNKLTKLPESIGNLTNLEELYVCDNKLTKLPSSIGNLINLVHLELGDNDLKSIPSSIGNLTKLEYLDLVDNKLVSLPREIGLLPKNVKITLYNNPKLKIIPGTLRGYPELLKSNWTKFEPLVLKPIVRRNVPLNTNRNDPMSGYNFSVGNNALNLGYNKYVTEKSLLNWIKTKNSRTNITNINTLYSLDPNRNIVPNPFTRQPLFRRNINFVKFVKPKTPNTLAKNLNKMKINNKPKTPNTPKTVRKKAGNAAQSRRTNVNNNNR